MCTNSVVALSGYVGQKLPVASNTPTITPTQYFLQDLHKKSDQPHYLLSYVHPDPPRGRVFYLWLRKLPATAAARSNLD